jgi:excisionase family DNA binding protein
MRLALSVKPPVVSRLQESARVDTHFYTVKEAADLLRCSSSFLYGLLASGRLKHYVLGEGQGGVRISSDQIDDYLRSVERGGPRPAESPAPMYRRKKFVFLPPS